MKTILDIIISHKKKEIKHLKETYNYVDFEHSIHFSTHCNSLKDSIQSKHFGIIAEIKRKSPSAGWIQKDLDVVRTGEQYKSANVAGISCLTDKMFFGGSNKDLQELKSQSGIPILRKEFILDEIQLFESKAIGADAVLLIAELLTKQELLHLTIMAQSLGMEVLMECHDLYNLNKMNDLVDIVGINNRNLHLQKTTLQTSFDLYPFIPSEKMCISESGIKTMDEIHQLSACGFNGALIGESILKNHAKSEFITNLQSSNYAFKN